MNNSIFYRYPIRFIFITIIIFPTLSFANQLPVFFGIKLSSPITNDINIESNRFDTYWFKPEKPDPYFDRNRYQFKAHTFSKKIYQIQAIKRLKNKKESNVNVCLSEKNKWTRQIKNNYGKPINTVSENSYNGKNLTTNATIRLKYNNFYFHLSCSSFHFFLTTGVDGKLYLDLLDEDKKLNNPKTEYLN